MKPEFAPLRVTVVDILGALLPGIVWLVVLATLLQLVTDPKVITTPMSAAMALVDAGSSKGVGFIGLLFLCALAVGYGTKPLTNAPAEVLAAWTGSRFPYANDHSGRPHLNELEKLALRMTGVEKLEDVKPLHVQPFSTCKRYLRVHCPALWEEAEHAEAETRMLGSLFLASAASALLVLVSALLAASWPPEATRAITLSALLVLVFGLAFRRRRKREVSLVYLNTLIALRDQEPPKVASDA